MRDQAMKCAASGEPGRSVRLREYSAGKYSFRGRLCDKHASEMFVRLVELATRKNLALKVA